MDPRSQIGVSLLLDSICHLANQIAKPITTSKEDMMDGVLNCDWLKITVDRSPIFICQFHFSSFE